MKKYRFFLLLWSGMVMLGYLAFREFFHLNILAYVGTQNIWESKRFLAFVVVSICAFFSVIYFLLVITKQRKIQIFSFLKTTPHWLKSITVIVLILLPGLLKWTFPLPENFTLGFWMELFLIFLIAVIAEFIFFSTNNPGDSLLRIGCLILFSGAGHAILYKLSQVSGYPFTLYWSEGNRFFDYSTLFGSNRYNLAEGDEIYAFTNWGMQLPWAIPFIFPGLTIGFFRLWYHLMWILPSLVLGFTASRLIKSDKRSLFITLIYAFWTFLFLDQGPIYAPLVIGAILTVIAVRMRTIPAMVVIFLTSFYTRNSRWTWSYAPGLWAGLLALMAIHKPSLKKEKIRELVKPVALGIAGYFGGHLVPAIIKSINLSTDITLIPNAVKSTTRQPLLWDRLFPNPTYPPGILWALVWAVLPVIILLVIQIINKNWQINWLQNLALLIIPGAFLTVGIIASVKIGGGSNLHNLDMFLVTLALIAFCAGELLIHRDAPNRRSLLTSIILFITLVSPVTFTLIGGERLIIPESEKVEKTLSTVQKMIEKYSHQGEILFIDQRQLLTFNLVKQVPLVDSYEKKYLMDQAMAENEEYFKTLYNDLARQRFALIVNEPANLVIRGSEHSFGEENDAYVKWVTVPLLCAYEPVFSEPVVSLELLVPRKTPLQTGINCDMLSTAN